MKVGYRNTSPVPGSAQAPSLCVYFGVGNGVSALGP